MRWKCVGGSVFTYDCRYRGIVLEFIFFHRCTEQTTEYNCVWLLPRNRFMNRIEQIEGTQSTVALVNTGEVTVKLSKRSLLVHIPLQHFSFMFPIFETRETFNKQKDSKQQQPSSAYNRNLWPQTHIHFFFRSFVLCVACFCFNIVVYPLT